MKNTVLIILCLLAALLYGCEKKSGTEETDAAAVIVINKVCGADVWILPETEENIKTTLWGTATVSKTETGKS